MSQMEFLLNLSSIFFPSLTQGPTNKNSNPGQETKTETETKTRYGVCACALQNSHFHQHKHLQVNSIDVSPDKYLGFYVHKNSTVAIVLVVDCEVLTGFANSKVNPCYHKRLPAVVKPPLTSPPKHLLYPPVSISTEAAISTPQMRAAERADKEKKHHTHQHPEDELPHGVIIAIAMGIMFLIALAFAAYNYCKKRSVLLAAACGHSLLAWALVLVHVR